MPFYTVSNAMCPRHIWTVRWENGPSDICAQRRLESISAFAQSDQSLHCPHKEISHPWLSKMRLVKILIRLRECTGWFESSLGAHVRRYVFWRCGSFHFQGGSCYCLSEQSRVHLNDIVPAKECNIPCPGNVAEMCGGSRTFTYYLFCEYKPLVPRVQLFKESLA